MSSPPAFSPYLHETCLFSEAKVWASFFNLSSLQPHSWVNFGPLAAPEFHLGFPSQVQGLPTQIYPRTVALPWVSPRGSPRGSSRWGAYPSPALISTSLLSPKPLHVTSGKTACLSWERGTALTSSSTGRETHPPVLYWNSGAATSLPSPPVYPLKTSRLHPASPFPHL